METLLSQWEAGKQPEFWETMEREVLTQKVKFPILEFLAVNWYPLIPPVEVHELALRIVKSEQDGSFVIAGKLLQLAMPMDMKKAFEYADRVIIKGNEWYACDLVAERVFGQGILLEFETAVDYLEPRRFHENFWVRRSVGVGVHLAAKRKPGSEKALKLMELLLPQIETRDFHEKKGCGWGIETIAQYYPEVALRYEQRINEKPVNAWVKRKFKLGLAKGEKKRNKT